MSKKLKVMTIIGTRPEIIRLSEVIKACDKYFEHTLVHTGQNFDYELNQIFFKELGLRAPDHYLECVGKNLGETMGNIIAKSYDLITKLKPEAILILGDTNSALSAISAKRLKVPIFHMEAGNRCWDWNVSEMVNRTIVDHISDINLPYTEHSRRYLLSEGVDGKTIFVTGSPMLEILSAHKDKIEKSDVLERLGLLKGKYIIVSAHREENVDIEDNFVELINSINKIAETYKVPIIFSTHPRTKNIIAKRDAKLHPLVQNHKPFGFFEYVKLQQNALVVLSDSGTLTEESNILHFPAVSIRTSTERPEGLDDGSIIIGVIKEKDVLEATALAIASKDEPFELSNQYRDKNVAIKVVKIIQGYTSIVNQNVWLKK
ncbi:MAG: UDP-N-acetylglucosamine 2-epimerase (non-hydrolyzing) [Erysipelotrichia bacterium]|nr:UDP-N-acetylglucosamine 2-epimerase (non-hydrolyzing) [Erysipelotrichia bacterium]